MDILVKFGACWYANTCSHMGEGEQAFPYRHGLVAQIPAKNKKVNYNLHIYLILTFPPVFIIIITKG